MNSENFLAKVQLVLTIAEKNHKLAHYVRKAAN